MAIPLIAAPIQLLNVEAKRGRSIAVRVLDVKAAKNAANTKPTANPIAAPFHVRPLVHARIPAVAVR